MILLKAKSAAMFMIGGMGLGAAAATFMMSNTQTKLKAQRLVNTAVDSAQHKMNKMN